VNVVLFMHVEVVGFNKSVLSNNSCECVYLNNNSQHVFAITGSRADIIFTQMVILRFIAPPGNLFDGLM